MPWIEAAVSLSLELAAVPPMMAVSECCRLWGVIFIKKDGIEIGFGAKELKDLETIDMEALDKRLKECTF